MPLLEGSRFTGFYGHPKVQRRSDFWELMRRLSCCGIEELPWIMEGDFNEVRCQADCCQRSRRPWSQIESYNRALKYCGLKPLPCDLKFTWHNQRKGEDVRWLRLDRFVGNRSAFDLMELRMVKGLDTHRSDHNPLLLDFCVKDLMTEEMNGDKRFYFEHKWLLDKKFPADFLWAKKKFESPTRELAKLRQQRLKLLKTGAESKNFHKELYKLNKEIEKMTEAEEIHWKQRSRTSSPSPKLISKVSEITTTFFGKAIQEQMGSNFTEHKVKKAVFEMHPNKGFSSLLRSYENQGLFSGISLARFRSTITNLFFTDDSLIFFKANEEVAKGFKEVLHIYESASSQVINLDKSTVSFSPNTKQSNIDGVLQQLGICESQGHAMYLGLPTFILKQKKIQFEYLRDRIFKKLQGWDNKLFSAGGKEVLIKSVLQSIPTYAMACFCLPVGICSDIQKACCDFCWGANEKGKNIHWASWDRLCKPKARGGVGFRKLCAFNQALLAKQVWRLLKNPNTLFGRVLKQRYFREGNLMEAKVADFISTDRQWNKDKLSEVFPAFLVPAICTIDIPHEPKSDTFFWGFDEMGRYSIKFGYLCTTDFYTTPENVSSSYDEHWWKKVWSLHVPPKVKHFCWRALNNLVSVDAILASRHIPVSGICSWCRRDWGTIVHCLISCDRVRDAWKNTGFWEDIGPLVHLSLRDLSGVVLDRKGIEGLELWCFQLCFVWKKFV
ncbi:uncharacterized protein LOC131025859 [Salvia miltiorrhiza]|uniref:uncharacterized protein LOC131025859 n=1 Tax=Salvia miltiorrhiza TaxID=226208 RepID=UPI0025AD6002|nr:uncharacterized protein LOC131025859 [Salvia miltiorrhiza]